MSFLDLIIQNQYQRIHSIAVKVGPIIIGASHSIVIQSMTISDTMNTKKTVDEIISIKNAGAQLVRLTTPNLKAAENLENIKNLLEQKNCKIPLVADIHFTPKAAEIAAKIVEKVRINPGNYVDRKQFNLKKYSHKEYQKEIKRIENKFIPLIKICKKYKTALRIGTNHGSLSDRIISQHGDNPKGMVESAFEFIKICENNDFDQIVISMKSSNPIVMVQAYRLLSKRMRKNKAYYPLHLGVTEAGDGQEGRIKSAVGIGSLLADGIGDTIRVSLTEKAEKEVTVCKKIIKYFDFKKNDLLHLQDIPCSFDPYEFSRRQTNTINHIGSSEVPKIILSAKETILKIEDLKQYQITKIKDIDKWESGEFAPDGIFLNQETDFINEPIGIPFMMPYANWKKNNNQNNYPYYDNFENFLNSSKKNEVSNFIHFSINDIKKLNQDAMKLLKKYPSIFVLEGIKKHISQEVRNIIFHFHQKKIFSPMMLMIKSNPKKDFENEVTEQALQAGPLLIDGLLDGLWMEGANEENIKVAYNILQATRARISKPDYISCPSCGRTLFDLQEVTAKIKSKTSHLKGVKIAIMGCIVNGPGEMADADFGYVGSGPGKITLYKKKEIVKRNIPSEKAVDALIDLLKENNVWKIPVK